MFKLILQESQTNTSFSTTTNVTESDISQASAVSVFCKVTLNSGGTTTSVKLQASNDGTNYADLANQTGTITATANFIFTITQPSFKYLRAVYVIGTANLTCVTTISAYGEG